MGSRQVLKLLAVVLTLMMVAAACNGDDDDDGADGGDGDGAPAGELQPVPGFDGETITLGNLTPLTGPVALIGEPLTAGHEVYWEAVNEEEGGVAGQFPVELVVEDTQYADEPTVQKYNATKGDVVMYEQVLGTPPTNAVLPLLNQDSAVAAPASLDAEWVREQQLLPIGAPYQIQMINGAAYFLENGGEGSTMCAFAQDDAYGDAGLEGVNFAGEELGFELETVARYARGDTEFTAQATQLADAGCEAVFAVSTPSETAGMIKAAIGQDFAPRWIGQSPMWVGPFPQLVGDPEYLAENLWVILDGRGWPDDSTEGGAKMLEDVEQYKPDQAPDGYFAFGYFQAWATHQVLEQAVEMGDLSRDGIVEAMNSLDELTFGGAIGDYAWGPPEERDPPRTNSIFEVDPDAAWGLGPIALDYGTDIASDFEF